MRPAGGRRIGVDGLGIVGACGADRAVAAQIGGEKLLLDRIRARDRKRRVGTEMVGAYGLIVGVTGDGQFTGKAVQRGGDSRDRRR